MGLKISGLNELRERLERLRAEEVMARALAEQADRMAARVRDGLSESPGAPDHDEPWLRSGALRDSVGAQADGLQAVVGSSDPAAVPQELGTAHMPARPFLVPVAAGMGEEVARAVAVAVASALRGDSPDADGTSAGALAPSHADVTEISGQARPTVGRSNTGGFDPGGVRLASETGKDPGDIEGEEQAGHEHTHHGVYVPEIVPGLHGPDTSSNIPHVPIPFLGGGRGSASTGAGGVRPTLTGPNAGRSGPAAPAGSPSNTAATGAEDLASETGILRAAAQGKGNFGIGQATETAADRLGRAWVGSNPTLANDGQTLVSQDGLRQYRPPSFRPRLGKMQANFEQRLVPQGQWQSNGHLDIVK